MLCSRQPLKSSMLILLALLLLSYSIGNSRCSAVPENSADMLSLLDFKQSVNDPEQVLKNWSAGTPYCQWTGVKCSHTHTDRVVTLDLAGQSLTGTLPPSLGNLTFLRTLNLASNQFSGYLPDFTHLRKLEFLSLSRNSLQGVIPDSLSNCSSLRKLVLHHNNLTGAIPPSLSDTKLEIISLPFNHLTGSIPTKLGRLSNLTVLHLGVNKLSGGFPEGILSMRSLTSLDLDSNLLHGKVPPNIGDALPNLRKLQLDNNMFEGQIPASLGNASGLGFIDLSANNFTGEIPASFGKLTSLTFLSLENNKLETPNRQSWEFLYALKNCTNLTVLTLDGNRLSGAIPDYIAELSTKLAYLLLDDNNLSGIVPSSIANYTDLISLGLSHNSLIGTIGEGIGMPKQLENLELENNNFDGPIPFSIGNLTQLVKLSLAQNSFTGTIPTSLGHLTQLTHLNLSHNNLQGNIPLEIFSIPTLVSCVLSYNNLEGPMPSEVGHLTQLTDLRLSSNKISGEIPSSLSQCQELNIITLDLNMLTGNIPMSFGSLRSLSFVNLSHNDLSGLIPTTICGIEPLIYLDLSYNRLQGEIPFGGVFANATAVSLNGNLGLCGGVKDLHIPACAAVSKRIGWKYYLTLLLIIIFGFMSLYTMFLGKKTLKRPYSLMLSFGKKFPRVSYKDLAQATENFSEFNQIGRGSYGSVYRGKLSQSKIQVAIKVFDLETRFADKSFVSECEVLRTIRHRNLLPVLTACSAIDNRGNDFKALVYEFMHNGNLDTWLHQKIGGVTPQHLGLAQRIKIAVDVADALVYLHYDCGRAIVHCDLKPTNILLDDEMNAYLGDFGIASLLSDSRSTTVGHSGSNSSVSVTGTIGYIPPEYAQSVHASTCGDVYSFGIVLLELLLGKRPTDSMFDGELSIVSFVERNFRDHILQIIDANLQEECRGFKQATLGTQNEVHRCLVSLVQVALSCSRLFPRERMNMREVAANLHSIRRSYVTAIKGDQAMLR